MEDFEMLKVKVDRLEQENRDAAINGSAFISKGLKHYLNKTEESLIPKRYSRRGAKIGFGGFWTFLWVNRTIRPRDLADGLK